MSDILPFRAALYSEKNRRRISELALPDLDTAEHLWGTTDATLSFRNVLVGSPEQRSEIWQAWIANGEIELCEEPSFYVLLQNCRIGSRRISRWAVFAELPLNSEKILVHEDVQPEGVERARQSMEACEGDMAPIFVGFDEGTAEEWRAFLRDTVEGKAPLMHFSEQGQSEHLVWRLTAVNAEAVQRHLENRHLYLLDGHHRFAAAKENFRLGMGDGKILACICSLAPVDTLLLPIHRAVYNPRWVLQDAFTADLVREGCRLKESDRRPQDLPALLENFSQDHRLRCYALHAHSDRLLELDLPAMPSLPASLAVLSVSSLDYGILSRLQGLTTIPVTEPMLALEQLAKDQAQVAFFLPSILPRQMREVARARLRMPRKSTRFMPKPALGLLCRPWQ